MRIEKIELIGFKSFADKTSFILHPGITCIVGPNGCGKSNIVDAFRWVLGEQSAKSLRGEKMEEVIFNGSALKKPKGMAEVTMSITGMNGTGGNGDGLNDQVTVTRRLYRSGESEYMLNKNQCRLRDVRDVFLDTGLDFKSYSILEQGRIGEILNSKPLERRFIIEEVAGVMKYKVRKAEAVSKLESARQNLIRINDIITEVRKQINILDRLAKKAERYKKLSSELHAIELKIARKEFHQINDAYMNILEEYNSLKEREAVMKADISGAENRTETRRMALLEKEKALEAIQKNFQALEREIAETERSVAVYRNDIANIGEYRTKITEQDREAEARGIEITARCEELKANSEKTGIEVQSLTQTLNEKTEMLSAISEELSDKEDLIEDKRREAFRITEELSSLRNELGKQQTSFESHERREVSASRESEDARRILAEIESSIGRIESEMYAQNNEILMLREKKTVLLRELSEGRTKLESLTKLLAETREEAASNASRLDSLREIVFDSPSRELLLSGGQIRLIATISEIFDVDAEYEKALESALAEKTESFVLETAEDIERAIHLLKGKEAGRTAFMPASPHPVAVHVNLPDGVVGRALEFVKVKDGYADIARNLLGNVLVVKDLKTAFSLRPSVPDQTLVTLDGEVIESSGVVVAGEGKGIFRRKREIRDLEAMIEKKKAEIEDLNSRIAALQGSIAGKEEAVRTIESSAVNIEKEISLSKLTVQNYSEDKERTSRKLAYLAIELEEIFKEKAVLTNAMQNAGQELQAVESRKAEIETDTAALQEGIAHKKAVLEQYRAEVTDVRLLITSHRERLESMKHEIESSAQALEGLRHKKEELRAEMEGLLSRIALRESEISGMEDRLRNFVAEADKLRADISARKDEIEKENEDLIVVEQGLRALRQQASEVLARISDLDVMRAEHKLRLENLAENIRQNYGREIEEVELLEVSTEEEARLIELKGKIQEMGPVNLGTLEEYEELSTRYEFMTKQQDDLNKSIAELEEAITKINSTTRKKLREAFEALKTKFSEVFLSLFGGGRAELVLTDESNILETGIDIIAQPPGKKLQNINLLSGGEKALTALSLQFASFLIKPTPLCILDEADAPLDETNTARFSQMLAELSRDTQFIVVTHNKTTMGIAQHLYGITMEEAGVSKVISMQLAEA